MIRQTAWLGALLLVIAGFVLLPAEIACAQDTSNDGERVRHGVDTPFYTLRGPDAPMIALIQTEEEVEYIGDYIGLDIKRAGSALRLLRHVDFEEYMLLVVNGGLVEGAMLRVETVFEKDGELHVEVTTEEPPQQYRDSGFGSPTSDTYSPSLVTVLPKFQGRLIVHVFPAEWATSGDLRGIELIVASSSADATEESGSGEISDENL
jgi:hypothetical protein